MKAAFSGVLSGWQLKALAISVALAAGGYLAFSLWGGWAETGAALARVGPLAVAVLLGLSLLNYGLRCVRWFHYLRLLGHRLPADFGLRVYLTGFALTTTPGKAGEALRSVFLKPCGVGYAHSIATLFAERLADLLTIVLLCLPGLWTYRPAQPVVIACLVALPLLLIALRRERWLRALQRALGARLPERLAGALGHGVDTVVHAGRLFRPTMLAWGLALGIVAWGAEALAFHYLLELLGVELDVSVSFFIYAFAMLVGALSFLPGGLGGAELTMLVLLLLNGADEAQAAAATVVIRLATLWFAVLLGVLALLRPPRADAKQSAR